MIIIKKSHFYMLVVALFTIALTLAGCVAAYVAVNRIVAPRIGTTQNVNANKEQGLVIIQALEDYKREHGQYPNNLGALVPTYLSELPKMRGGGDFRYLPYIPYTNRYDLCFFFEFGCTSCCYMHTQYGSTWECCTYGD